MSYLEELVIELSDLERVTGEQELLPMLRNILDQLAGVQKRLEVMGEYGLNREAEFHQQLAVSEQDRQDQIDLTIERAEEVKQLRQQLAELADKVREECAKVCESQTEGFAATSVWDEAALSCARAIRAMKKRP